VGSQAVSRTIAGAISGRSKLRLQRPGSSLRYGRDDKPALPFAAAGMTKIEFRLDNAGSDITPHTD
jgi:hypothetical protein